MQPNTNPNSKPVRTIDLTPQARSLMQLIAAGASTVSNSQFTGRFGPGYPPMPIEPETEPRLFQYQPGVNLMMIPRMGFGLLPFSSLRSMAAACKEIRLNIEQIKRTMRGLDWAIVPNDKRKTVVGGKTYVATPESDSVRKFFEKPDGVNNFDSWLNMVVEEILVTDALTLWAANEGKDLVAIEVIDGTTIKPLVDLRGGTPRPPMPAYLQIIYGTPSSAYPANTLFYRPLNTKVYSPYGESPIEWILTTINTAIRKDLSSVGYFAEGNIPGAFYTVPESWTPEQIQIFQDYIDSIMTGDLSRLWKLLAVPGGTGSHVTQFQQNDQDNVTLNEYLMRVACWAFGNNPSEFGLTGGEGLGGKGFMDGGENAQQRSMIGPVSSFLEKIFTEITHDLLRRPDLRFSFAGLDPVEDQASQATVDQTNITMGVYTVAYVQDRLAIPPEYRPAIAPNTTPQAGAGSTLPMPLPPGYERYLKAAVQGDLEKWKDKQLRALKKRWGVVTFTSEVIPADLSEQISGTLKTLEKTGALDEASVTSVFAYAGTTELLAKGDYEGHPFRGNQHATGTGEGSGDFDSLEDLSTKRPERLPELKEGDTVVINGHRGAVQSVKVQSRKDYIPDDLDPVGPMREVQRKVTTVRIVNDAMQEMKFTFGGMGKDAPAGDLEKRDPRYDAEAELTKDLTVYFDGLVERITKAVGPESMGKGGRGSGNFNHAGRQGKVGGSAPKGTVTVGELNDANIQKKVDDICARLGFPPEKVFVSKTFSLVVAGSYDPQEDQITLSPLSLGDNMGPVLAHEISHAKFNKTDEARWREPLKEWTTEYLASSGDELGYDERNEYEDNYRILVKEMGGVSGYSNTFWTDKFGDPVKNDHYFKFAVNETFAEIARLDYEGKGDEVPPNWRDVYERTFSK